MKYQYRALERFWKSFYGLSSPQKESVRKVWKIFQQDPFHPSLGTHEIHALSAKARHTIYSVVVEGDLRVLFSDRWILGNNARRGNSQDL